MPIKTITEALAKVLDASQPGKGAGLVAALRELDAAVAAHGDSLDPHLRHYLERRSYAKAAAFLGLPAR